VTQDNPVATERLARIGYDYLVLDAQHGLLGRAALIAGLMATDAAGAAVGLVRVEANDTTCIGQALDAGAGGVIVPLVDDAEGAAAAVAAARYPPAGLRSFGPLRARMRIGPGLADTNSAVVVLAMIETLPGLTDVAGICATPGLDGVYVGVNDLRISLGGASGDDPALDSAFETALATILAAAAEHGVAAGIHTTSGREAALRLSEGWTFASVASDLAHLEQIAASHLSDTKDQMPVDSTPPTRAR
jgi:4-hydroxy-2-oxoheptanedioate aldolase